MARLGWSALIESRKCDVENIAIRRIKDEVCDGAIGNGVISVDVGPGISAVGGQAQVAQSGAESISVRSAITGSKGNGGNFAAHFGAVPKPERRGAAEEIVAAPEVVCAGNENVIVGGRLLEASHKRSAKA